jgi:replicative DNA helicase
MSTINTLHTYGPSFQIKVMSSLLKHKEFLQNIHDILNTDMFDNPAHKWIVGEILRYYYKYHTTSSVDSLQVEVRKIDNEVLKISVVEQLKEALKASNEDRDYIEQEFSAFCRNQQIKKAILNSVTLLEQGKYEDIKYMMDSALKAGQDKSLGHEYEKDIETRYREQERSPIATKWPRINELLMGGLGIGDLGLIFGNPGGGKSWLLVSLGAEAVMRGFTVNHYTLELSEYYVGKRYDSLFTGIDVQNVHKHRVTIEETVSKLPGKLVIKEFPMGKASVHTIESHIQKCRDLGFPPDLVIIDYVDLLKSKTKSIDPKDAIDDIYAATKGMARELKVPIWTVSQVNRAGAKDDVIEGDKAAGSYNKMMIVDFAMSLSRKRQDKVNGTGRMHIMKNRYGMDGMTFAAKINTSNGTIEISPDSMDEDDLTFSDQTNSATSGSKPFSSSFDKEERQHLVNKFFELSSPQN